MVHDVTDGIRRPLLVEEGMIGGDARPFVLPTGTVTLLLTDVEGSSRLWEQAPAAMARAIPRHYELLDNVIASNGGVRPVEQGEGDSVVAAFSRASEAAAAAIELQHAFATEPWPDGIDLRVRMAIHTGEPLLRDEGNYAGEVLNRAARIRAVGHGGQILVSAACAELLAGHTPDTTFLVDLGLHRLKDLGRAERIWQLTDLDLPAHYPPLRSLNAVRRNLPIQLSPLIGRTREIAAVQALLTTDRLVTLTGSAGVGKSRLAQAVSAEAADTAHSVLWVELAPLSNPDGVGSAALAATGAREMPGATAVDQLAVELGDQRSLVVLDNCEHVIAGCAELVARLLAANASTSVLATSREPLGVPGEITVRVPSLICPSPELVLDVETLSQYDAVALFVERARRAQPSFTINEANAAVIAQICYRLDGIPLAIELAAARCRQMSPRRVAAELDDRFRLLTGGARTVMARQQTMAASVDWSHDRLDDLERVTFRRLGVFAGPFPVEAAEGVVAAAGKVDPAEVFDLVSRLVDKSLVAVNEHIDGEVRYRLLETLRAYALDRAGAEGELTILRDAHAVWWADWIEPRGAMPTDEVLDEVEEYHDNLAAALDWAVDKPLLGLRLLRGVARAWETLGRSADGLAAADALLTDDNAQRYAAEWLSAANGLDGLYWLARGPQQHEAFLERVESVALRVGDDYHVVQARWHSDPPGSIAAVRDVARDRGDRFLEAEATIALASNLAEDEPTAATPLLREAHALAATSGNRYLRASARTMNAEAAATRGDLAETISIATGILRSASSSSWGDAVRVLGFSALLAKDQQALHLAVDVADRALRMSPGLTVWAYNARHRLQLLQGHPSIVDPYWPDPSMRADPPSSGTLWLLGREALDAEATDVALVQVRAWARPVPHAQAVLAAIEAAATSDENRWHEALTIALTQGLRLIAVDALEGLAVAAASNESPVECLRLAAAATRLRDETGYQWRFAREQALIDQARNAACTELDDQADVAIGEGRELDWLSAATYARRALGERTRPRHG